MVIRSVDEIIDAAFKTVIARLNAENRGKERYQKRMKNKKRLV
ncbi:hypothetical protein [Clostridium sp. VAP41]|nr:hypothetical protein [Clostridium sp. VAP41]